MNTVKLLAVGDISLETRDNKHLFEGVKEALWDKDILFGNLEVPLSSHGREAEKAVVLHAVPDKASYLKNVGFDILNIANNHILDLGPEGFHNTLAVFRSEGLGFIGANDDLESGHLIIERQGTRLGFLGYSESGISLPKSQVWINKIDLANIIRDITSLKSECDFIIVSLHWGIENVFYPSPRQIELAHRIIDAGAIVVLGHHPHVIQGIERYKHGLIAYSLGNFQFSSRRNTSTNNSMILCLEFSKEGLKNYQIIPIVIGEDFAPWLVLDNGTKEEMLNFIDEISQPLERGTMSERWWFEQIAWEYLSGNLKSFVIRVNKYGFGHFFQAIAWLISPFCLRCYAAILRRKLKQLLVRP